MNDQFSPESAREALQARGLSLREASRQMSYNVSYLSRVLSGKQKPSAAFQSAFRSLVSPFPKDVGEDAGYRSHFEALLRHDSRFGGDNVASAGLQVWQWEQAILDRTVDPAPGQVSAVAELAEVAGWLCYSAGRYDEARQAFGESLTLARHCRDQGMQWFAADMLAMVAVAQGRPGEAVRLAEASLELSSQVPGRIAVMARVRRARALAMAGDHTRSWQEMSRALGGLEDSLSDRDPVWTWWITPGELAGHKGEMLMSLGQPMEAIACFRKAVAETDDDRARAGLSYRVAELHALSESQEWRACETALSDMAPLLGTVSSGMVRTHLGAAVRSLRRSAPDWLVDVSRDVLSASTQPAAGH